MARYPSWPKGADCKSAGERLRGFKSSPRHHRGADGLWDGHGGRNESEVARRPEGSGRHVASRRGNSSVVERQPSKLGVAGSNPVSRSISQVGVGPASGRREAGPAWTGDVVDAHVAQSVEHVLGKDGVTGSSPVMGSSPLVRRRVRAARGG